MKLILLSCLSFLFINVSAQNRKDSGFIFSGFIFSEDSIPVENVHVINYGDTKIVTTNENGFFKIQVKTGDSLMINHLSLMPTRIHANKKNPESNKFYITQRRYLIGTVSTIENERRFILNENLENFTYNVDEMVLEYRITKLKAPINPYNPEREMTGIDLKGFLKLLRKKKKK